MTELNQIDLAHRYFVNDLPSANIPATRLRNILDNLQQGVQLSVSALNYMKQQGLVALEQFARNAITYEGFCGIAGPEQATRIQVAEAARLAREADRDAREAVRAAAYNRERLLADRARLARETDPMYIAELKSQQLRMRYGLDQFIKVPFLGRLMDILSRIDGGNRLTDDDVWWLKTEGRDYYKEKLQAAFHEREAEYFAAEYSRTSDPWNAVNASSHYRKCDQAEKANDLLTSIPSERQTSRKLKSAICTTHGGVKRDLGNLQEALNLGGQAHSLTPRDFRPCTLLGAVNIELGNLDIGWEWYRKAKERGASEHSIDHDLRGIFLRADNARRENIKSFLLREDPVRYAWVTTLVPGN